MSSIERELKLSLCKEDYETLLQVGDTEPQLQTNYYFYAEGMPSDIMLRIRLKKGKYMFCYKKLLSASNGVNVCDEREKEIDEAYAKALIARGLNSSDLKTLVDVQLPYEYKCVGSLNSYRAKFLLDRWSIELDRNEYLNTVDYELECECASDELLGKLKDYLYYNYGIVFARSLSKSARFFKKLFQEK